MRAYLELMADVINNGQHRYTRAVDPKTGTHVAAYSVFARQLRHDLSESFPLLTTKKMAWSAIVWELLWFLRGETNIKWLQERNVYIWDEWADPDGNVGPIYGKQWRSWEGKDGRQIDQLRNVINSIRDRDLSARRRLVVSAWNVADLEDMRLPPCHLLFQFYPDVYDRLSCQVYQRSADIFLGVPFNIASYALLTRMVAHSCKMEPGELIMVFGDLHLYENHMEQAQLQLLRRPKLHPQLWLDPHIRDIDAFDISHIQIHGYSSHPKLTAEVAV